MKIHCFHQRVEESWQESAGPEEPRSVSGQVSEQTYVGWLLDYQILHTVHLYILLCIHVVQVPQLYVFQGLWKQRLLTISKPRFLLSHLHTSRFPSTIAAWPIRGHMEHPEDSSIFFWRFDRESLGLWHPLRHLFESFPVHNGFNYRKSPKGPNLTKSLWNSTSIYSKDLPNPCARMQTVILLSISTPTN